jgi:beta-galactosidase GanA
VLLLYAMVNPFVYVFCVIYVHRYVEWSQHEPSPGHFEFSEELDLQYFIQLAQEEELLVLLRPGPYICAERDMVRLLPLYVS